MNLLEHTSLSYKPEFTINSNPGLLSMEHSGIVVGLLDFRLEGCWFEARLVSVLLSRLFTPRCLASPTCINGYWG